MFYLRRLSNRLLVTSLLLLLAACDGSVGPAVVKAPSGLTYKTDPATYRVGTAIAPNTPTSGGSAVASYAVTPALPAGLTLDTATGVISGTPSAPTASADYTVTAANAGGRAGDI